jgi:hypothetical protein
MKPLSETYKEMGIAFSFPIEITDANGNVTYYEDSNGYWARYERDANGNPTYFEDRDGWEKWERDDNGNETYWKDSGDNWVKFGRDAKGDWTYCEYSDGVKTGTPRSTTNQ